MSALSRLLFGFVLLCFVGPGFSAPFSDDNLEELLAENTDGMILVWSKDMPLSGLALEEAPGVARALGLKLTVIEDREMKSTVLASEGILNHFPAVMVYRDQKLLNFLIQGYEVPESLIRILEDVR